MDKYEITDRYKALGIPYPDPKTACSPCDGIGKHPSRGPDGEFCIVTCEACGGTGKRLPDSEAEDD